MDSSSVRKHLEELRSELARIDAEREVIVSIVQGYENWQRIHDGGGAARATKPSALAPVSPKASARPRASGEKVSFRGTVLRVLRESPGMPLRPEEILARVTTLGGATKSENPVGMVDLVANGFMKDGKPIAKGPERRTWVWTESTENGTPPLEGFDLPGDPAAHHE